MMNRALMQRQMFAGGGAVKQGYHRMPDGTIMPNSAMRYGGDVKKMQMGGEPSAAPSAAPADMSGIAGMLSQAEQSTAQETAQMGSDYAQGVMSGIDGAEDFKSMIDSIRGNDMPIQARYEELAGYVGPEDAQRTPESVLAMVQPTLMMTEEGAMGSGIGELMQGIAGSVEMETEGGQATPMGQGVGSMLMAGAQEPVQAFRHGGHVQKLAPGGEAVAAPNPTTIDLPQLNTSGLPTKSAIQSTFPQMYKDRLAVYEQALGRDPEERKKEMQSNILFDIAQRGLAFASGVDPQTGENIANRPMGAQLARQIQTLPGTIGEQLMAERQRKEGIQLAALQSAEAGEKAAFEQASAERAQRFSAAKDVYQQYTAQSFQKGENESDRDHQKRLAKADRDLRVQLQNLQGAQTQDQINLRGDIEERLKRLQGEIETGQIRLTHSNNMTMQGAKTADQIEIITKQSGLDIAKGQALINAQGVVDQDNIKARGQVENALQSARLAHEVSENALQRIEERLTVDTQAGVQIRGQDIQRAIATESTEAQKQIAEWNNKNRLELSDRERALQESILEKRQAFDTVENQLNRELQKGIADQDDERIRYLEGEKNRLQMELQNDQQEWLTGESNLDREVKYAYLDADLRKAFFDRQLAYKTLETEKDIANLKARVESEKARLSRFGSGMEGVANQALSSPDILRAWGAGELDEDSEQLIRQAIMQYAGPETVETEDGFVTKPARKLAPEITELLIFAAPDLYQTMYQDSQGYQSPYLNDPKVDGAPSEDIAGVDPIAAQLGFPIYGRKLPSGEIDNRGIAPLSEVAFPIPTTQFDMASATGWQGAWNNLTNKAADAFGGNIDEQALFSRQILTKLRTQMTALPEAALEGRATNFLLENFDKLVPKPEEFFTGPVETAAAVRTLLGQALQMERSNALALNNSAVSNKQRQNAIGTINSLRPIIVTLSALETASRPLLDTPSPYANLSKQFGGEQAGQAESGGFMNYFLN